MRLNVFGFNYGILFINALLTMVIGMANYKNIFGWIFCVLFAYFLACMTFDSNDAISEQDVSEVTKE